MPIEMNDKIKRDPSVTPAGIGAIQNAGGTPSVLANAEANRPAAGVAGRVFIATDTQRIYRDTGTAWVLVGVVNWADVANKPATFPPSAHKSTHASGGADPLTPADIGAVNKAGDTMTGALTVNGLSVTLPGNAYIELGRVDGFASTPYIDFHSGATAVDYDARIIALGGNGTNAGGVLNLEASGVMVRGYSIWHAGNDGAGSGLSADDTDGIHFRVSGGVLQWSNNGGVTWKNMGDLIGRTQRIANLADTSVPGGGYVTIVNFTGGPGVVQGFIYINLSTSNLFRLKVTVDGTALAESRELPYSTTWLTLMIPFTSSVKIELHNTSTSAYTVGASLIYAA